MKRIASQCNNIQDLSFRVKYLKGDRMICDYDSQHATPIDRFTQEQESLGFDVGIDVYVSKIINLSNSPNVLDTDQLGNAASLDPKYQQLMMAVNKIVSLLLRVVSTTNLCKTLHWWCSYSLWQQNHTWCMFAIPVCIPDACKHAGGIIVHTKMLDFVHEGHPGENALKRSVRSSQRWMKKSVKSST